MNIWELVILAFALSMDAFAVSVCLGLSAQKTTFKRVLIVGLYFGLFQAIMPLIGFFLGSLLTESFETFDHWLVFALLTFLGIKMIVGCFKDKKQEHKETSLHPRTMLPYALVTSIDALAVGISLAFLNTHIWYAVLIIGVITLMVSMLGVALGSLFGLKFKLKAELIGGIILILIGIKIVLEHTGVLLI